MKTLAMRLWSNDEGQDLIEYGLLIGIITLASVIAMTAIGGKVKAYFTNLTRRCREDGRGRRDEPSVGARAIGSAGVIGSLPQMRRTGPDRVRTADRPHRGRRRGGVPGHPHEDGGSIRRPG